MTLTRNTVRVMFDRQLARDHSQLNVRSHHVDGELEDCTIEMVGGDVAEAAKVYQRGEGAWWWWIRLKNCVMGNFHVVRLWCHDVSLI